MSQVIEFRTGMSDVSPVLGPNSDDLKKGWTIRAIARERWLTPEEILDFLRNFRAMGFSTSRQPAQDTSNGQLYIFDRSELYHFKSDGGNWVKRKKESDRVREDFSKLSIDGEWCLTGFYTRGAIDTSHMRRCYREKAEKSALHLVHYRHTGSSPTVSARAASTLSATSNAATSIIAFQPTFGPALSQIEILIIITVPLSEAVLKDGVQVLFGATAVDSEVIQPTVLRCHTPVLPSGNVHLSLLTSTRRALCLPSDRPFTFAPASDDSPLLQPPQVPPPSSSSSAVERFTSPCSSTAVSADDAMDAMLARDEIAFQALANQTTSPMDAYRPHTGTTDDMGHGSASAGKDFMNVASPSSMSPSPQLGARRRALHADSGGNDDADAIDRSHKIRLVERLGSLHDDWPDDGSLNLLPTSDLSALLERYTMSVVAQLVDMASDNQELIHELNLLDRHGHNLLHYCCLFSQTGLIPVLLRRGVDANARTRQGCTPLHIACGIGSRSIAQILIQEGASLFEKDGDDHYPCQVAMGCGHHDLSDYLLVQGTAQEGLCPSDYSTWVGRVDDGPLLSQASLATYMNTDGAALGGTADLSGTTDILKGMFNDLPIKDKCAFSQSMSEGELGDGSSLGLGEEGEWDLDMQSVLSESDKESLTEAMRYMGTNELAEVNDEVQRIQVNVRSWLLRKNYLSLREAARTLQGAWRERRTHRPHLHLDLHRRQGLGSFPEKISQDEAAATLQRFARNFRLLQQQAVASLMVNDKISNTAR